MRARKTAKYLKAIEKAAELKLRVSLHERDLIYNALESAGYFWSSDKKTWAQDNAGRSVFEAPDGSPLPHARVRVTSHYETAMAYARLIADACETGDIRIEFVTEEPEINDKGAGARVYMHIYTQTIPQGEYTTGLMKPKRTTNEAILNSTSDDYMNCPNCGSFHLYRDLRDRVNSCHGCGFTHLVGIKTVQETLERMEKKQ